MVPNNKLIKKLTHQLVLLVFIFFLQMIFDSFLVRERWYLEQFEKIIYVYLLIISQMLLLKTVIIVCVK